MPNVAALVPAAGQGSRLGRGPKAFLPFGGTSLLDFTLQAFDGLVDECVVAVSADMVGAVESHLTRPAKVVLGGRTRQETVENLLQATHADIVLIHDAARPFLARSLVAEVVEVVCSSGAACVVAPVADTLVTLGGEPVDRDALRAVQTPQGFRRELISAAHARARGDGFQATDDAALVRRSGHAVSLVAGNAWLFKITTPTDYDMARALVEAWRAHA
ncbi:2-C-methyl-D-erythritol 4-phosphate cytidylyltransferase [soil metagenome]